MELEFKKQGDALILKDSVWHHEYEIQKTENETFALRVDGEVIHIFDNLDYAMRVAGLIEEDSWN